MKTICILGLGYIGLPTASMFATHDIRVIGVDINSHIIDILNHGSIHIEELGLRSLVREAMASGNLIVKSEPEPADAFIIAVPTPFNPDKTADVRAVLSASEAITPHLSRGNLVVLESTSPPRTTVDLVQPILESSGLKGGKDFLLAYSPERVLPGRVLKELVENARVIGGINQASAEAGRDLYATFVEGEIVLTDATTAEMVKLMENTFRDVNIALANEFALIAEQVGVNVWEAIGIANHHPRVKILQPGPGVGGHCIAVDPWFLVEAAPEQARLIRQARLVNDAMPGHVVELVRKVVAEIDKPTVACLGLAYKADVGDTRVSPAIEVVKQLIAAGLDVRAFGPHVEACAEVREQLTQSLTAAVQGADVVVILVDHAEFKSLTPEALTGMRRRNIVDTRNCLKAAIWQQAGFQVVSLGSTRGRSKGSSENG